LASFKIFLLQNVIHYKSTASRSHATSTIGISWILKIKSIEYKVMKSENTMKLIVINIMIGKISGKHYDDY
jgi:hypothetical protein